MRLLSLLLFSLCSLAQAAPPADTHQFTDDLQRTVTVPLHPQRIVSLHDLDITIPLIELGVMPVGSHGRTDAEGHHFLRSGKLLTGIDFDNSPIQFIGTADIDMEKITALKPDLIITEPGRRVDIAQLAQIAPTISIDHLKGGPARIYRQLAILTATEPQLARLQARYQAQIAQLKHTLGKRNVTVSVIHANNGKINLMHTYHALGQVLRDAGLRFPPLVDAIPENGRMDISAERLPEIDADIIFDTWRADTGGTPQDEIEGMNAVLPGWCQFLKACQRGHYVLVSREEAISNSYASLSQMVAAVQTQLAALALAPAAGGK